MNPMLILFVARLNEQVGSVYNEHNTIMLIRFYDFMSKNYCGLHMNSYFDIKSLGVLEPYK